MRVGVFAVLLAHCFCAALVSAQQAEPVRRVTVCQLVERESEFNGKVVEVHAIVTRVFHAAVVAPRGCAISGPNYISLVLRGPNTKSTARLLRIVQKRAATAQIKGTFHAGDVYGGGNCCRFELRAEAISQVRELQKGVALGLVNAQTVSVTDSGVSHLEPGIVVRFRGTTSKVHSYGISNEAGVLVMPLPADRYCYDALSRDGMRLQMIRQASERCFVVKKDQDLTVGVEFRLGGIGD